MKPKKLLKISFYVLLSAAFSSIAKAQGGNTCAAASSNPITVPATYTGQTTCGMGNDFNSSIYGTCPGPAGTGGAIYSNPEWFYYLCSPINGYITITLNNMVSSPINAPSQPWLIVMNGCPTSGGVCVGTDYIQVPTNKTVSGLAVSFLATAGQCYYIIVDAVGTSSGSSSWAPCFNYDITTSFAPLNTIQPGCTNMDFESGTTNGWYCSSGQSNGQPGMKQVSIGQLPKRHMITSSGTDPCGGFPVVAPGGNYSLRLCDSTNAGGFADQISQTFKVSGTNANFKYQYAVVLNDGTHSPPGQAFFKALLKDQNGDTIPCSEFFVAVQAGLPGFVQAPSCAVPGVGGGLTYYKPWSTVNVDLSAYIGQNVTIEFTAGDCSAGGHYGYAYVDAACSPVYSNSTTVCTGQCTTLQAPTGYASYLWSPGGSTAQSITVCPGATTIYTLTLTGFNGCSTTHKDTVRVNPCTTVKVSATGAGVCPGSCANLSTTVTSGTAPYTYNWNNGQSNATINVCPALTTTYTVTITDATAATATASVVATVSSQSLNIITSSSNIICGGACTGSSNAIVTNGTSPYSFIWSNSQTSQTATGLCAGTYTVSVNDVNGCISTRVVNITQPVELVLGYSTQWSCSTNKATSTINVINGTSPYIYSWSSSGQTGQTATGLAPGNYTVTVVDSKGCSATKTVAILAQPVVIAVTTTNISCTTSGSATANVVSGVFPFTYSWSNGVTTFENKGLPAGIYTVTVTSSNGCTATQTTNVTGTSPVSATFTNPPACIGVNVTFTNTGSTGTYTWTIGGITNLTGTTANFSYTFLTAGTYSVTHTVTSGSCNATITKNITVTNCNGPTVTATGTSVCPGTCATITSTGSGGTSPYTYSWSNNATTQNISPCPVSTTTYTVTIRDAGGNTSTSTAIATINPAVTAGVTATNTTCSGGTNGSSVANPGGGTSPYTYSWSNGQTTSTATGLSQGTYTVKVTDSKGCTSTSTTTLISPPSLAGQFTKGTANCTACGCKEWIMVNASGGTSPYSYSWSNSGGYPNRYKNQLCPGSYIVNIVDKNGCSVNINLTAP